MKKILAGTFFIVMVAGNVHSQNSQEEVDFFITTIGPEKKALAREFMKIDQSNSYEFWRLFDEYEVKQKELTKKRWILLNQYAACIESMSDDQATDMMKEIISQSKTTNKLIETYYKKIRKVTSAKVAAKFYQFEHFLLSGTHLEILNLFPFTGEL
ncbi:MAG: hypothetical protein KFF73_13175 [Cyclobacteriaceae bacterium]|nr:hypothetical protein [Cyclobacteriaceae bacterium]